MNVCPPNPGLTDITTTKSRSPAMSSSAEAGVDGLSTAPACAPSARMKASVRCRCGTASTCTDTMLAPAFDEVLDVAVGLLDHQVHVERPRRDALDRPHHRRADRDVGDEVAVHHVHVNQIGAAALGGRDVAPERREVGRQDRRRECGSAPVTGSPRARRRRWPSP